MPLWTGERFREDPSWQDEPKTKNDQNHLSRRIFPTREREAEGHFLNGRFRVPSPLRFSRHTQPFDLTNNDDPLPGPRPAQSFPGLSGITLLVSNLCFIFYSMFSVDGSGSGARTVVMVYVVFDMCMSCLPVGVGVGGSLDNAFNSLLVLATNLIRGTIRRTPVPCLDGVWLGFGHVVSMMGTTNDTRPSGRRRHRIPGRRVLHAARTLYHVDGAPPDGLDMAGLAPTSRFSLPPAHPRSTWT
jgi:hypothetical protein